MNDLDRDEELNALLDQELSVEETAVLTQHLTNLPKRLAVLAELAQLRQAFAQAYPEDEPSADLRTRIEALLAAESSGAGRKNVMFFRLRASPQRLGWIGGAVAAAAALVMLVFNPGDESSELMAVHDASQRIELSQANVAQPSPPTVRGFTLASARSDIVAGHRAQVLVYNSGADTITLCIWPTNGEAAHNVRNENYQGTEVSYWNDGNNEFWAESAKPGESLKRFVHSLAAV